MTATDELREKLDELGIEHFDYDKGGRTQTQWEAPDGKRHFTYETSDNPAKTARLVIAWHPTPEQAIAATLGRGERTCHADEVTHRNCKYSVNRGWCERVCHNTWDVELTGRLRFQCSECGAVSLEITPNYCPSCGAKVIGD